MNEKKGMRIISLIIEGIKRIAAVEINPDGSVVLLCGKNKQGKTSVLDSIWWALDGAKNIQKQPIRNGQETAFIKLDLGELKIVRNFKRKKDGGFTTSILVTSADGASYSQAQTMLDSLLEELCFDPIEFADMAKNKPKDAISMLRRFVPEVDFDAIATAHQVDTDRRTSVGRLADQERAAANAIIVPKDTPEELIPEDELTDKLTKASEENNQLLLRRQNRTKKQLEAAAAKESIASVDKRIAEFVQEKERIRDVEISGLEEQIKRLREAIAEKEQRIENVSSNCYADVTRRSDEIRFKAQADQKVIDDIEAKIAAAGELPELTKVGEINEEIREARKTNIDVRQLQLKIRHGQTAQKYDKEYEDLTAAINKRQADKRARIAAAKMPVPGISFDGDMILLNEVPFDQASDAEQLDASCRIAMAMNPRLRVMRVRQGSRLDSDALKMIEQLCEEHDFQAWIERVDETGLVGFIMEDGHVRKALSEEVEEATA